jgi:hypothetical protein
MNKMGAPKRRRLNPATMQRKMQRVKALREIAFAADLYHSLLGRDFVFVPAVSHLLRVMKETALQILDGLLPDVPVLVDPAELEIRDISVKPGPIGRFAVLYRGQLVCGRVFETQSAALLWIRSQLVRDAMPVPAKLADFAVPVEKSGDKSWSVH